MLNDFEIIVWMIWLKLVNFPTEENKVLDFLQIIALFVKQSNNPESLYLVFDKFYSHNYPNFYARFKNSEKPNILLTSADINKYYREITKNFDYKREKGIKDYNYEVDALEAEHDKREVHTTTKFGYEKLESMKEEAKTSNALLNYGNKEKKIKDKNLKEDLTKKRSQKMADKELEQIKEELGGFRESQVESFPREVSGTKLEKIKPQENSFMPPSFTNKGGDQMGFMPLSGEGKQPSINIPGWQSNSLLGGGSKILYDF